jgi:hypothetical protein
MSAEIVSLQAWRRQHGAHQEPEAGAVSVPLLVPTWPCGWLQPMWLEIDVAMIAQLGVLAAGLGGLFYPAPPPRPARPRCRSAAIHRLFRAPAPQGKAACDQ